MKSRVAQYLNEVVSITIMLLMTAALIAAQAAASDRAASEEAKRAEYRIVLTNSDE